MRAHSSKLQRGVNLIPFFLSAALHFAFLGNLFLKVEQPEPAVFGHWVEVETPPAAAPLAKKAQVQAPSPLAAEETMAAPAVPQAADSVQNLSERSGETPATLKDRYLFELETFFNSRKIYPARARHLGLSGSVEVSFHLEQDGSFSDPHVTRPCIHDVLNEAALHLVKDVGRYRPLPAELNLRVLHVTVPIQYELN